MGVWRGAWMAPPQYVGLGVRRPTHACPSTGQSTRRRRPRRGPVARTTAGPSPPVDGSVVGGCHDEYSSAACLPVDGYACASVDPACSSQRCVPAGASGSAHIDGRMCWRGACPAHALARLCIDVRDFINRERIRICWRGACPAHALARLQHVRRTHSAAPAQRRHSGPALCRSALCCRHRPKAAPARSGRAQYSSLGDYGGRDSRPRM